MKKLIILQDEQGDIIKMWPTYVAAAKDLGVRDQTVNYICRGYIKHSFKVKGKLSVIWITKEEMALLKAKGHI